jgi:hypothetical protein
MITAIIIIAIAVYALCFRHHRGFGVFYSLRGPFHTWIRITKRF